jgi:threonine/homoserine/homoserine lactone efflux protein
MFTFAFAVFFFFITPGSGVLSAAGVGLAYGYRKGVRYFIGLFIGTNIVSLAVISGLAAIMMLNPPMRAFFLFASVGYLLYLAFRIAFSGNRLAFIKAPVVPGVLSGILFQVINPKAYAVNTAFFSGFAFWLSSLTTETLIKLAIMNTIWIPIHMGWFAAGVTVRRLDLEPRT